MYNVCPICDHNEHIKLIGITDMPVYCNILLGSKDLALAANLGDIDLVACPNCSHIYNKTFDPGKMDYDVEYENSLHYSATFADYTENLANKLVDTHNLKGKNIVEIGCGKGDFLESVCAAGNNQGYGFDRSYDKNRFDKFAFPHVNFYQEFYGPEHTNIPMDFLCCRHVLEHIQYPIDFINEIKTIAKNFDQAGIYFEVPNGLFTLRDFGIWDIIYEHCSYFTPHSLRYTFDKCNLDVSNIEETFNAQFLSLEAKKSVHATKEVPQKPEGQASQTFINLANSFFDDYQKLQSSWKEKFIDYKRRNYTVVIWGAGSKGITFMNIFKNNGEIQYAVDLNPHKHGKFAPGSGQEIIPPEKLKKILPDVIIVMNKAYLAEISSTAKNLGLGAELIPV